MQYYASCAGCGNGTSDHCPFFISDAWAVLQPGDTLFLLSGGIYTGPKSMIQPPPDKAGTPGAPITIKAMHDGQVLIDGQGVHSRPVNLDWSQGNDYFVIEGINVRNGVNSCIKSSGTGNIFRRCIAWGVVQGGDGEQTWAANGYNGLIEDCASFGGRYCLGANQMGIDAPGPITTFRRCFAMYTGAVEASPKASFIYWYNSDPVRYENCIGTWDQLVAPNSQGIFYCATAEDDSIHGALPAELIGCIIYLKASQGAPAAISGISAQGNRRITIDNCAIHIALTHPASGLKAFDLRAASTNQSGPLDLIVKNSTAIGPSSNIHSDWSQTNVKVDDNLADVYGSQSLWDNDGTKGAYIDPTGFLPLPMNQRIYDASILAGLTPINVMNDLEGIFGSIPVTS